jgi:hypothetical protein
MPFDYSEFEATVLNGSVKTQDGQEKSLALSTKIELFTPKFIHKLGMQTSVKSNEYVKDAVEVFKALLPPEETIRLDKLIKQEALRASIRLDQSRTAIIKAIELIYQKGFVSIEDFTQTPKIREFVERNPWLIDKLNSIHNAYQSQKEALEKMKKEFPEWVESFENSGLRKDTATLRALTTYLRDARNNPQDYPKTNEFLRGIQAP